MPMRERSSARSRVTSRPRWKMAPLVAGRSPESRLMRVDLPAPLGPMSAWNRPRWTSRETSLTAERPPKRLHSARDASAASDMERLPRGRLPEAVGDPGQAAGKEDHQQDDGGPEEELPALGERLEEFLEQHEGEGPGHPAAEAPQAAEDQHQERVARLVPGEQLRVHEAELERREVAGQPPDGPGDGEAGELVTEDREPQRCHPVLVALDALEGPPQRRPQEEPEEGEDRHQRRQREVVEVRG